MKLNELFKSVYISKDPLNESTSISYVVDFTNITVSLSTYEEGYLIEWNSSWLTNKIEIPKSAKNDEDYKNCAIIDNTKHKYYPTKTYWAWSSDDFAPKNSKNSFYVNELNNIESDVRKYISLLGDK